MTNSYPVALPTNNTTGLAKLDYQMLRSVKDGNLEDVYRRLRQIVYEFNHGSPIATAQQIALLKRVHLVFATLAQLGAEIGALIDANPGHLSGVRMVLVTSCKSDPGHENLFVVVFKSPVD